MQPFDRKRAQVFIFENRTHNFIFEIVVVVKVAKVVASPQDYPSESANITNQVQKTVDCS
jgi:hypothetical protein